MSSTAPDNTFVQLLIGCQNRIYAFIFSLLGNADHAADVLQETNRVLLESSHKFVAGTNFMAFAFQVAYNQVRTHRKKVGRDRLMFDDDALQLLADEASEYDGGASEQQQALVDCLEKLPKHHRALVRSRYYHGMSVKALAERVGRSASSISVTLFRTRAALMDCIERTLAKAKA